MDSELAGAFSAEIKYNLSKILNFYEFSEKHDSFEKLVENILRKVTAMKAIAAFSGRADYAEVFREIYKVLERVGTKPHGLRLRILANMKEVFSRLSVSDLLEDFNTALPELVPLLADPEGFLERRLRIETAEYDLYHFFMRFRQFDEVMRTMEKNTEILKQWKELSEMKRFMETKSTELTRIFGFANSVDFGAEDSEIYLNPVSIEIILEIIRRVLHISCGVGGENRTILMFSSNDNSLIFDIYSAATLQLIISPEEKLYDSMRGFVEMTKTDEKKDEFFLNMLERECSGIDFSPEDREGLKGIRFTFPESFYVRA